MAVLGTKVIVSGGAGSTGGGAGASAAEMTSRLLSILGDARLLWVANATDTTTSTDKSRNERTITWSESLGSFDTPPATLGNGVIVNFNGSDEEGDTPDVDALSFGDGANDEAFSILCLFRAETVASATLVAKRDQTTGDTEQEYALYTDSNGDLTFSLWDDSASDANIGRKRDTALTADKWYLAVVTYDGSRSISGVKVYLNGAQVDDANVTSGTYVAMENLDAAVSIAHWLDTSGAASELFDGDMAIVAVCAKEITIDEQWAIKVLLADFYGETLD